MLCAPQGPHVQVRHRIKIVLKKGALGPAQQSPLNGNKVRLAPTASPRHTIGLQPRCIEEMTIGDSLLLPLGEGELLTLDIYTCNLRSEHKLNTLLPEPLLKALHHQLGLHHTGVWAP